MTKEYPLWNLRYKSNVFLQSGHALPYLAYANDKVLHLQYFMYLNGHK